MEYEGLILFGSVTNRYSSPNPNATDAEAWRSL